VLLLAQFAIPPSEFWFLVPQRHVLVASLVVAAIVASGGVVVWKVVGHDRRARFFATGMVLSTFPVCATWPSDRLLLAVGFGAFGLVALFLAEASAVAGRLRFVTRPLAGAFVVLHLVLGPLLPVRGAGRVAVQAPHRRGAEAPTARGGRRHHVILNAPNALFRASVTKRVVDTGAKGRQRSSPRRHHRRNQRSSGWTSARCLEFRASRRPLSRFFRARGFGQVRRSISSDFTCGSDR
jgi:hypothetical protein